MSFPHLFFLASCLFCVRSYENVALRKPASQSTTYYGYGPYLAVDGDDRALFHQGTCSHTGTSQLSAWWSVNLQHIYRIRLINITYRHNPVRVTSLTRMKGLYLFVSNSSDYLSGELIFHDKGEEVLPFKLTVNCDIWGQYITYFNNRTRPTRPGYSQWAFIELCEMEVFTGCNANQFGPSCNRTCNCFSGGCDPDTGVCDEPESGCKKGWSGQSCNQACQEGNYGYNCELKCHCLGGTCDPKDGVCSSGKCERGFNGESCDQVCEGGNFGYNCKSKCYCHKTGCDPVNGRCWVPGCQQGMMGVSCDKVCDIDYFGYDCSEACHCKTGGCNRMSGVCKVPGCQDGYSGVSCNIKNMDGTSTRIFKNLFNITIFNCIILLCVFSCLIVIMLASYQLYKRYTHEKAQFCDKTLEKNRLDIKYVYQSSDSELQPNTYEGTDNKDFKKDEKTCSSTTF